MQRLRELDLQIAKAGWGVCPMPKSWHEFFVQLQRRVGQCIELQKPLILAGWSASYYKKRHHFLEQLIVAEDAGLTEWALDYLNRLGSEDWLAPFGVEALYPKQNQVFYITARGGSLRRGFADALQERLISFDGVEVNGQFLKMSHIDQVNQIHRDLLRNDKKTIIASSYGAYLLLSVLVEHEVQLGDVMLISPITGRSTLEGTYFRPAGASVVETAISECEFAGNVANLNVVVGEDDRQADPERCLLMTAAFSGRCNVIPNQGHQVSHGKIGWCLDDFFRTTVA